MAPPLTRQITQPLPERSHLQQAQTTEQIPVIIQGDTVNNVPETFNVTLSTPTNATIATGTGIGTIDDIAPTLSINNTTVTAPLTGTTTDDFTVTLSAASNQAVTVNYATSDGTATNPTDYTATTGTITFAAGVKQLNKSLSSSKATQPIMLLKHLMSP